MFFGFFELLVLDKRSRDHRTHGIVENSMADPMRALPGPCEASWGPKVPLKVRNTRLGHKSTLSEKFRGIMKIGIQQILVTNQEHICPGLLAPI